MAYDTVEITPGAGAPIAVDLIGGDAFQRVKLVGGDEGNAEGIAGSAAEGLMVDLARLRDDAASITSQTDQATSVQLLASTAARKGLILHNNSPATLYIKYGTTASIAAGGYSVKIPADAYWEMPLPIYTGRIDGIWSSDSTGYVEMTEL